MQKPHRFVIDRVAGYADEAAAYLRRRRQTRKPFARVYGPGGRGRAHAPESEEGHRLFQAATALIEVAER